MKRKINPESTWLRKMDHEVKYQLFHQLQNDLKCINCDSMPRPESLLRFCPNRHTICNGCFIGESCCTVSSSRAAAQGDETLFQRFTFAGLFGPSRSLSSCPKFASGSSIPMFVYRFWLRRRSDEKGCLAGA